jgi:hypothetical protein
VKDLAAGVATFERNFGLAADATRGGEMPAMGLKNAFIPVADSGEADIEIIQPLGEEGAVATFAKERGEGQFLLSIAVDNIEAAVEKLRAAGARVSDPRGGLAFVSMKSSHGVNIQLVQR